MAKKNKKVSGFLWGLILGGLIAAGAIYYYQNHYRKTEIEKLEDKAQKEIEKAQKNVKKLLE
jgi:hypothetical protein